MAVLLAIASAIAYGVSDFTGGLLSRRAHVFSVVLLSQLVSFALVLVFLPFWQSGICAQALGWGGGAGVAGFSGAALLYRGLAIGRMSVVAPITGLLSAAIPVVFGMVLGERPGPIASAGVALGMLAVLMISSATGPIPLAATAAEGSAPIQGHPSGKAFLRLSVQGWGLVCSSSFWNEHPQARDCGLLWGRGYQWLPVP
jgi:drug/metabolite transporter (DMT)-like permease